MIAEETAEEEAVHRVWEHHRQTACRFKEPEAQRTEGGRVWECPVAFHCDLEKVKPPGPWQERQPALAGAHTLLPEYTAGGRRSAHSSARIHSGAGLGAPWPSSCPHRAQAGTTQGTGRNRASAAQRCAKVVSGPGVILQTLLLECLFIPAAGFTWSRHVC